MLYKAIFLIVAAIFFGAAPATASDKNDVMVVVNQWTDVFGAADPKKPLAACAAETLILDDLPPYVWTGAGACSQWLSELNVFVKQNEMTEVKGTLAKPWHVDVTSDLAYVVVPITFSYKQAGKEVKEPRSIMALVLQKGPAGWRITSWSVAAH